MIVIKLRAVIKLNQFRCKAVDWGLFVVDGYKANRFKAVREAADDVMESFLVLRPSETQSDMSLLTVWRASLNYWRWILHLWIFVKKFDKERIVIRKLRDEFKELSFM